MDGDEDGDDEQREIYSWCFVIEPQLMTRNPPRGGELKGKERTPVIEGNNHWFSTSSSRRLSSVSEESVKGMSAKNSTSLPVLFKGKYWALLCCMYLTGGSLMDPWGVKVLDCSRWFHKKTVYALRADSSSEANSTLFCNYIFLLFLLRAKLHLS